MLGASFLPARFRSDHGHSGPSNPGYINRWITPYLQTVSRSAFTHPIHTIVFVAVLASTSYIGILEGSIIDHTSLAGSGSGGTDLASLADGGRRMRLGAETSWKWQNENGELSMIGVPNVGVRCLRNCNDLLTLGQATQHLVLVTLVFPDSLSNVYPRNAPQPDKIPMPYNSSAQFLPNTPNALSSFSHDTSLAVAVPFSEASTFLAGIKEIPNEETLSEDAEGLDPHLTMSWVMEAAEKAGEDTMLLASWASSAWTKFVDLIKVIAP